MSWRPSSNRPQIVLGLFSDRSRRPQIVLKSSNRPQIVFKSFLNRPQSSSSRPQSSSNRSTSSSGSSSDRPKSSPHVLRNVLTSAMHAFSVARCTLDMCGSANQRNQPSIPVVHCLCGMDTLMMLAATAVLRWPLPASIVHAPNARPSNICRPLASCPPGSSRRVPIPDIPRRMFATTQSPILFPMLWQSMLPREILPMCLGHGLLTSM